jgi:hypothetical protein
MKTPKTPTLTPSSSSSTTKNSTTN